MMRSVGLTVFAVCLLGCGGGGSNAPKLVPAAGIANFKGEPVADATITFYPEKGPVGIGKTDAKGALQIKTNGALGAVAGKHKVTVGSPQQQSNEAPPMDGKELEWAKNQKSALPSRYASAETTDLVIDLSTSGNKDLTLDLTE